MTLWGGGVEINSEIFNPEISTLRFFTVWISLVWIQSLPGFLFAEIVAIVLLFLLFLLFY